MEFTELEQRLVSRHECIDIEVTHHGEEVRVVGIGELRVGLVGAREFVE